VHDHLIIGRGGHTSFRDLGLIRPYSKNTEVNLVGSVFPLHSALHNENPPGWGFIFRRSYYDIRL